MPKNFIDWESEKASKPELNEQEGRKNEAVDQSPEIPEKELRDDELIRLESEKKLKDKKGESFIPEDELIDEDTENFEDLIIEDIDAHRPVGEGFGLEDDPSTKEFNEKDEFTSKNKNYLPFAIWKIKRKYSLPREEWRNLSDDEKRKVNKKKQEEINELYIKKAAPAEKKKAA